MRDWLAGVLYRLAAWVKGVEAVPLEPEPPVRLVQGCPHQSLIRYKDDRVYCRDCGKVVEE